MDLKSTRKVPDMPNGHETGWRVEREALWYKLHFHALEAEYISNFLELDPQEESWV